MMIYDFTDHSAAVPNLKRMSSKVEYIVLHRIEVDLLENECEADGVLRFFMNEPWGVATTQFSGANVGQMVRKFENSGVPEPLKEKSYVPYHYIADSMGMTTQFLPEFIAGAHAYPNSKSIGVGVFGDHRKSPPKKIQLSETLLLCDKLLKRHRHAKLVRHDDLRKTPKQCPGGRFPWGQFRELNKKHGRA